MTKTKKSAKAQQTTASSTPATDTASDVAALVPLTDCPLCGKRAIVALTPEQRLAQPDDTTHVCHPMLGGCNHGFTDERTRSLIGSAEAPKEKAVRVPKAIAFDAQSELRAVKAGTKLASLIDALAREQGATLEELATELSRSGSKVDVSGVKSWISYDLRKTGLGIRQEGDRLYLVGTALAHKEAAPKKAAPVAAEPMMKVVRGDAKAKKAAMRPPKKAKVK